MPAEYISEVIPIKYAMADDIANALNSLGGSGGGTVSFGGSTAASPINGIKTQSGGTAGNTGDGGVNPSQTSTGTWLASNGRRRTDGRHYFSATVAVHHQRAPDGGSGQQEQIQVFGQTKIIADQRSNSLLIFATRQDMDTDQAGYFGTGRAALPSAHRIGHHRLFAWPQHA